MKLLDSIKTEKINKLISSAEVHADAYMIENPISNVEAANLKWSEIYHMEMDRLTKDAGLRC